MLLPCLTCESLAGLFFNIVLFLCSLLRYHITLRETQQNQKNVPNLQTTTRGRNRYTIGVGDALKANIKESNIWGLFSDNLSVSEASATCYNEAKQDLYVPSTDGKELNATSITRYMRLKAKISYDIYPLTFVGGTLFFPKGEGLKKITLVKEYDATRVLKSESRTG